MRESTSNSQQSHPNHLFLSRLLPVIEPLKCQTLCLYSPSSGSLPTTNAESKFTRQARRRYGGPHAGLTISEKHLLSILANQMVLWLVSVCTRRDKCSCTHPAASHECAI
eukprot:2281458-Pleurochrysis_carterae.AAC.3